MTDQDRRLLQETHDAVIRMEGKTDEHHKTLYGNGRPGLVEDVRALAQNQKSCRARAEFDIPGRALATQTWGNWIALAALAAAVLAIVLS